MKKLSLEDLFHTIEIFDLEVIQNGIFPYLLNYNKTEIHTDNITKQLCNSYLNPSYFHSKVRSMSLSFSRGKGYLFTTRRFSFKWKRYCIQQDINKMVKLD